VMPMPVRAKLIPLNRYRNPIGLAVGDRRSFLILS
jgi:hypothetical protein